VGSIVFGALLLGLGLWLLIEWLPAHRPFTEAEALAIGRDVALGKVERLDEWRLKPGPYYAAIAVAIIFAAWGLSRILRGATYRPAR
jgi:hypothetical protein